jgi:hypothetical protein
MREDCRPVTAGGYRERANAIYNLSQSFGVPWVGLGNPFTLAPRLAPIAGTTDSSRG